MRIGAQQRSFYEKIISVFLMILIFTGLSGCGKSRTNRIRDAIQGNWIYSYTIFSQKYETRITFKNDTYSLVFSDGERGSGKYVIEDEIIKLYNGDSGRYWWITYTYNADSNSLTMWWKDDKNDRLYPDW